MVPGSDHSCAFWDYRTATGRQYSVESDFHFEEVREFAPFIVRDIKAESVPKSHSGSFSEKFIATSQSVFITGIIGDFETIAATYAQELRYEYAMPGAVARLWRNRGLIGNLAFSTSISMAPKW